jgi:hypothetical protein
VTVNAPLPAETPQLPRSHAPLSSAAPKQPLPRLALASAEGRSGNPIPKILAALAVVVAAIAAYVYFNEKPPVAVGEVIRLTAYPIHRVSNAIPEGSRAARVELNFDEIVVIAQVRIHNQSDGPLFLSDMAALLSLPGEEHRSLAASAGDYNRVFIAYPQLIPMKQQPLLRDTTIPAGESVEGQLIFNYPITKDQWDLRRSLDITLSFLHQKDLTLPAPQ